MTIRCVENIAARFEQAVNPIDWAPYIASFTGMIRILAGAVQVAVGAAFAVLKVIHSLLTNRIYYHDIEHGILFSLHGLGNMIRGSFAMLPFINLTLILYDYRVGRMNYEYEILRKDVYPLMTAHRFA